MISIRITALNDIGERAIRKHVEESAKVDRKRKLMLRMLGWRQEVISADPYELLVEMRHKGLSQMLRKNDLLKEIEIALTANGATKDTDYVMQDDE